MSPAESCHPHFCVFSFQNVIDIVSANSVVIQPCAIYGKIGTIKTIQAILCAYPNKTSAILVDGIDRTLRQAIFNTNMPEAHFMKLRESVVIDSQYQPGQKDRSAENTHNSKIGIAVDKYLHKSDQVRSILSLFRHFSQAVLILFRSLSKTTLPSTIHHGATACRKANSVSTSEA